MKSVDAHLDDSLAGVEPLEAIDLQLLDAHGCILAEEVVAPWAIPGFDIDHGTGGFEPGGLRVQYSQNPGFGGVEAGLLFELAERGLFGVFPFVDEAGGETEVVLAAAGPILAD